MTTTITAQIGEASDRITQWAEHGGHRVSPARGDAALSLARVLIAAGYDPGTPYQVARGGTCCMRYRSLGVAAGLTVEEGDRVPVRIVKYRPRPDGLAEVSGGVKDAV